MLNTLEAALTTCVIVFSAGTNGDWQEKYWHEMAHCNGWVHAERASTFGKAYDPPKRFLRLYEGPIKSPCGNKPCSVERARKLCKAAIGVNAMACMWME